MSDDISVHLEVLTISLSLWAPEGCYRMSAVVCCVQPDCIWFGYVAQLSQHRNRCVYVLCVRVVICVALVLLRWHPCVIARLL